MENQRTQTKVAMNYGTLYGLAGVAIFLLFYFLGMDIESKLPQFISYIVLCIFIITGIKVTGMKTLADKSAMAKRFGQAH